MQDRGYSTLTLLHCRWDVPKHATAVSQYTVTSKMKAVQKQRGGGLMWSLNKQLSAASKNVSAEQCSWLRPQIFTQQRANREGTFKRAAMLFSDVQVCDVFLRQSSQWPSWVLPCSERSFLFTLSWHFCTSYITFKVKFHFSNVKKSILLCNAQSHFLPQRNNHRYGNHLFTHTGPIMHLQCMCLHCTCTCPIFTHEMWYSTKSSAANNVTKRNWELVVQGLCVEKKAICREKLMLIDILSRLHIPGDSVTIDRWWENREVGCSRGCTRGVPQTLGKKNECSRRADSPIPQSSPLASTEFLHG